MIDTRSKTIRLVSRYPNNQCGRMTLPSRVSYYLNSYSGSSNGGTSLSPSKKHVDNGAPPPVVVDDLQTNNVTNTPVQFSCNSSAEQMQQVSEIVSPEKKILAALEEIPDLARDDMLKAYSILSHDNGRRFRSLMELPMSLRKDWFHGNRSQATAIICLVGGHRLPRWVLLSASGDREVTDGSYSTADAKTLVTGRTSTSVPIGVSLVIVAPPVVSRVRLYFPPGNRPLYAVAVASGLLSERKAGCGTGRTTTEQEFGRLGRRSDGPERRKLDNMATSLLRRGEEELVVAELTMVEKEAELVLFRSGEWCVKRPTISRDSDDNLLSMWRSCTIATTVTAVGDKLLCWANLFCGLMLSDVFDESPVLRFVPLPTVEMEPRPGPGPSRNVSVLAGGTVKFVNVFPLLLRRRGCHQLPSFSTRLHHQDVDAEDG
ncbi:hypothetical protein ACP70R_004006 [Stipagrostis hirtigluma subsp. patula]